MYSTTVELGFIVKDWRVFFTEKFTKIRFF